MSLYHKYRPTKIEQIVGQTKAISVLKSLAKKGLPHAILATGPSGCGKTTIARIIAKRVKCNGHDLHECNAASRNGIDFIREIEAAARMRPMFGDSRVWIIDEAQQLTTAAQNAFLKILEDCPPHAYFILCTTDPQKLLKTIHTRCSELKLAAVKNDALYELLDSVAENERIQLYEEVRDKLVEYAENSPRKLLVLLEQIAGIDGEEDQTAALTAPDAKAQAYSLFKALMNPRSRWTEVRDILKGIDEDPESIRWLMLGCATTAMLNGRDAGRASVVIGAFAENFFDTKKAGLVAAAYNVMHD